MAVLLAVAAGAAEIAVFSISTSRLDELEKTETRAGRSLAELRRRPAALLGALWTVRLGGVALGLYGAWHLTSLLAADKVLLNTAAGVAAVLALVLSEFAGKTLGQRWGEGLALLVAVPIWAVSRLLWIVTWSAELISRLLSPKQLEIMPGISDREIRDIVSPGTEPLIEEHERLLIERAFLLDQTTAYDVMTPRVDMLAWRDDRPLAEIASELRAARYSRIPLYAGGIDRITGVLYIRDAYQALISGQRDVDLKSLAREPFFVPGSVTLDKLLLDFQARRMHMGIVIDEYGGVDGLITLEDILEELVGEIIDETDIAEESITRLTRNEILVDGSADLREINHFFNTTFPMLEHRSLNGYLLELFGQVPQPGERILTEGVEIEVTAATETQVVRARLSRLTPRSESDESEAFREQRDVTNLDRRPRPTRTPDHGR